MRAMEATSLASAAYGLSWVVGLLLEGGLLVVALAVVRPKRPDVASLLGISALIGVAGSCLGIVMPMISARMGVDALVRTNAMTALLGAALHAIAFSLILVSIVRLTRPRVAPREF